MISVCMATYNGAPFVAEQIRSILSQLADGDELLISDDGSTDHTLAIIQSFNDKRIQLFHGGFKNLIKNFENALRKASGDHIFLADQDDIWQPNKVKSMMTAFEKGAALVVSDCTLIDDTGAVITDSFFSLRPPESGLTANLYKNSFMGCCMAFHKSILQKSLPFPSTIPMHDSWIGMVALAYGEEVSFLPEKLVLYRRHGGALSTTGAISTAPLTKKLSDRINLAGRLALRRLGLA